MWGRTMKNHAEVLIHQSAHVLAFIEKRRAIGAGLLTPPKPGPQVSTSRFTAIGDRRASPDRLLTRRNPGPKVSTALFTQK